MISPGRKAAPRERPPVPPRGRSTGPERVGNDPAPVRSRLPVTRCAARNVARNRLCVPLFSLVLLRLFLFRNAAPQKAKPASIAWIFAGFVEKTSCKFDRFFVSH